MNKLIKTVLENPQYIDDLVTSGLLDDKNARKLLLIKSHWEKHHTIPWKQIKNDFDIAMEESDMDFFFAKMEETNLFNFNLALKNITDKGLIGEEDLAELSAVYLKRYNSDPEHAIEIANIQDAFAVYRQRKKEQGERIVKTYYDNVDRSLDGGMRAGGIYCLMGPTGVYKSTFLTNFARSMWEHNLNILYISTEMNEIDTLDRILQSWVLERDVNAMGLKIRNMKSTSIPTSLLKVVKVHPYDTRPKQLIDLVGELDWKPHAIFIDYADELLPDRRADNDYDAQGIIYAGLKTLGEIYDAPVVTATQTNRESLEKGTTGTKMTYGIDALSDSSKKARLVDAMFSIIRTDEDKRFNTLHLHTVKSRFSGHERLHFVINHSFWRINPDDGSPREAAARKEKPNTDWTFLYIDSAVPEQVDLFSRYKDLNSSEQVASLKEKKRSLVIDDIDYKKIRNEFTAYRKFMSIKNEPNYREGEDVL